MASEDVQTNLRIPADLKEELLAAAARNNRSLSAEVVFRLVHSFRQDPEVLQPGEAVALVKEREALMLQLDVVSARLSTMSFAADMKTEMLRLATDRGDKDAVQRLEEERQGLLREMDTAAKRVTDLKGRIAEIEADLKLPDWPGAVAKYENKWPKS